MKLKTRLFALVLAACILGGTIPTTMASPAPQAQAQNQSVRGSISATLRIDYPQPLSLLQKRQVTAQLWQSGKVLVSLPLWQAGTTAQGGYTCRVIHRNENGGELVNAGEQPGYIDLEVSGLPQGTYTLYLSGTGYKPFTRNVILSDSCQHVTLGTGDATFTLGDVNGDGAVNQADRDSLAAHLGASSQSDLDLYDLNGDGKIDIIDLAYVSRMTSATGDCVVRSGALLTLQLEEAAVLQELAQNNTQLSGSLSGLLTPDSTGVTLSSTSADGQLVLPLPLTAPAQVEQLVIFTPESAGRIESGTVLVEDDQGAVEEIPFDNALPEGIHTLSATPGSSTITIDLGRRVAVKKVTVTVTQTQEGYAVVQSIQFLQDIIPETPAADSTQVKNLTAAAGDSKVDLTWNVLPNVSGYRVDYWPQDGSQAVRSLRVGTNQAAVTGLKNLTRYLFTVTPVDDGWEGKACQAVLAIPTPASPPKAPDMVSLGVLDGALSVSWKAAENATFYQVYYREKEPQGAYRVFGSQVTGTGTTITGLTNGTVYQVYVVAGNPIGVSGPSLVAEGTPAAADYSRPQGIPTAGLLDPSKIADIRLGDPNNYDRTANPNGVDPKTLIDGDFSTSWTTARWTGNEHVICTFTQPVDLYSAIWAPRMDGSYPSYLRAYSVRVWLSGDDLNGEGRLLVPDPAKGGVDNSGGSGGSDVFTWPNISNYASSASDRFAVLPFGPVKGVVKISVAVEQRDYLIVSLSELMFLEYDPSLCLPDNINALFADELHTRLRSGVTQGEIDALRTRLTGEERRYYLNTSALDDELVLAQELLNTGRSTGVVLSGLDSRSASVDRSRYSQSGSELQPLGVAAGAGQELTVYAQGIPAGSTVTVWASQYNAEASAWLAQVGTLTNGRNVLTVPKIGSGANSASGGSLYVTYSGANAAGISLHLRRGTSIPMLDLSDWYSMSDSQRQSAIQTYVTQLTNYLASAGINSANQQTLWRNVTEIATPTVLLSLPASAVSSGLGSGSLQNRSDTLYNAVLAWEDLMHVCMTTQGIDRTYEQNDMQTRQNIRCMRMFSGAFMFAAGSYIGIGFGSSSGMVTGRPILQMASGASSNSLYGWGIAHEIGHNMDKLGKAEITNNIYSLMVQTYDGNRNTLPSRLEASRKYEDIFTRTAQGWPGASGDVFLQLGMYWQLHLAYDNSGSQEFYNRFFKAWKAGTYFAGASSYDDRVALTAAGVAGRDLTEFFTRWGMELSQSTKDRLSAYPAESRAIWYLSDQSRQDRLNGVAAARGTFTARAAANGDSGVTVTITPSITGSVQGYEILRNGVSVGFTTGTTFQDDVGSANHRVYSYTVIAYDTLGNQIGSAVSAGDVRVAYDQTVPASDYTLERSGTTVTFRLKAETDVSGIKLSGTGRPLSGSYTVAITGADGKTYTARTGSFADNLAADDRDSFVTYLNKPGADSQDTRIWTYSAVTVTITGVPAAMADAGIQLIRYAGDDIALLEGGCVGLLAQDYRYGTGQNDVIPKGTLVIAGTYRGDPVYNTIELRGRFLEQTMEEDGETSLRLVERAISGYTLLFAEIPDSGAVSDISDGFFLFVPDIQAEQLLQGETSHCTAANLLPSQISAVLYRTDDPNSASSKRLTAQTLWYASPGGDELPIILLDGDTTQGGNR